MDIIEILDDLEKQNITRYILEALPEWFGLPESREEYIQDSVGKIFFYLSLGFKEFEIIPTLWDEWNPCQIYVMAL